MNPKTICFDFDGVLCEYAGWKGHDNIGKPNQEMIKLVEKLHDRGHTLILCTTRLNPYPFVDRPYDEDKAVTTGKAEELLRGWLQEQGIETFFSYVGCKKLMADYYIDDRAIRYISAEKDKFGGFCGVEIYQLLL